MVHEQPAPLVQLPDPCLLAVLQSLADDPASLCSAARARSRMHAAAVVALSSVKTACIRTQQKVDSSLLPYLSKYGQHVDSLCLRGEVNIRFRQLPPEVQLTSLKCYGANLQLQPGNGFQGLLGVSGLPLKHLEFSHNSYRGCKLLDGVQGLVAALSMLPGLEHLVVSHAYNNTASLCFPTAALLQLPQLTHLEVVSSCLYSATDAVTAMQPLKALTRLADLRLWVSGQCSTDGTLVTASILSCHYDLTRLELAHELEPAALSGKTRLRHLQLKRGSIRGGAAGIAQLLCQLQYMQQLTHLGLEDILFSEQGNPPAAVFSGLTASSKLQYLNVVNIRECTLPAGVWQHIFPTGRQLPNLQTLIVGSVHEFLGDADVHQQPQPTLECSRLASCCPNLRRLEMQGLSCSVQSLSPVTRLIDLSKLSLGLPNAPDSAYVMQCICQMTGLGDLKHLVVASRTAYAEGLLLQLTQLTQLTYLNCWPSPVKANRYGTFFPKNPATGGLDPHGEPVWHQVLTLHHDDVDNMLSDDIKLQAAAALASLPL